MSFDTRHYNQHTAKDNHLTTPTYVMPSGEAVTYLDTSGLALVHSSGHSLTRRVDERHKTEEHEAFLGFGVDRGLWIPREKARCECMRLRY